MSVGTPESEIGRIIVDLDRIKGNLSDVRSFETSTVDSSVDGNVIGMRVRQARSEYKDLLKLIDSLIATADWCNCEWYDDVAVNPEMVARVLEYLDTNEYDVTRCDRSQWGRPARAVDNPATLNRVHSVAGLAHLPHLRVYRPELQTAEEGCPPW